MDWTALPETVTTGIADRTGGFCDVVPAASGDHAEIAVTVTGSDGVIFVKAAASEFGVRSLRYELQASNAVTQPYSPAVEWHFETDGWLVVGFEHCAGPHADLSPGSADLDLRGGALTILGETPAPGRSWFSPAVRLGFPHPAMDGEALVHTDLNPANLIVTPRGLRIVDWAMATKAAPWIELALLTQWLISSGHTPAQAEEWLARHPSWATRYAAKWSAKAQQSAAAWTGRWSTYQRNTARG